MKKILIVQNLCTHYRVPLFRKLAECIDLVVCYGRGDSFGSYKNSEKICGFRAVELPVIQFATIKMRDIDYRVRWFPTLSRFLQRESPKIIIAEGFTNLFNNIFVLRYTLKRQIPFIIWDSGRQVGKPMRILRRLMEPANVFLLKRADAIIAYSSVARQYFISLGIESKKIFVANNTIDVQACLACANSAEMDENHLELVRKKLGLHGKKVLLFVGALEKRKNIDVLIRMYAKLKCKLFDLVLLIVGDGPDRDRLERIVCDSGAKDCIFLGKVVEGVGTYFSLCDVFVLPGRGGLAINEAMCYGKPVVVGEGDGTEKDLIEDGINGYIVADHTLMENSLYEILTNDIRRAAMGSSAKGKIRKFDLDNMRSAFLDAIKYAVKKYE